MSSQLTTDDGRRTFEPWRTLRWSTWLGWQIESNWANPWLFTVYLVVKPITGSLMLVCMFFAAKAAADGLSDAGLGGGRVPPELLPYVYVSNAVFGLVGGVMFGMGYVVITDRETYRMLKYIYISPGHFQTYFLGRGLARGLEGVVGGTITILAGLTLPGIRAHLSWAAIDWGWLAVFLSVGFVTLWAAGMILASAVMNLNRNSMFLSEGIGGVVYFLSGVVFPLSILPGWLQAVSLALPTTYWLEGMRRSIAGPSPGGPLATWTNLDLLGALAVSTAGLVVVSQLYYRHSVRKAWRNGKIEEATGG
jgi:ABC-2 type transport system permease protein